MRRRVLPRTQLSKGPALNEVDADATVVRATAVKVIQFSGGPRDAAAVEHDLSRNHHGGRAGGEVG